MKALSLMKINVPKAKLNAEFQFEVQKSLAPQKIGEQRKKVFPLENRKNTKTFSRTVGKSARRFFRAGSRRGEFFVRDVSAARRSARRSFRAGDGRGMDPYRRVDAVSAKRLRVVGPGGAGPPPPQFARSFANVKFFVEGVLAKPVGYHWQSCVH